MALAKEPTISTSPFASTAAAAADSASDPPKARAQIGLPFVSSFATKMSVLPFETNVSLPNLIDPANPPTRIAFPSASDTIAPTVCASAFPNSSPHSGSAHTTPSQFSSPGLAQSSVSSGNTSPAHRPHAPSSPHTCMPAAQSPTPSVAFGPM